MNETEAVLVNDAAIARNLMLINFAQRETDKGGGE